ncbi:MAG: DEAD/DEAH box helicase family protein [Bacteroidales bacterium]|nr:DEAD/DEAH box helicase family protein [Bacteroidales bacterium]
MNEAQTRHDKINPKLYAVGWDSVPGSKLLMEQSAYQIVPGRVSRLGGKAKKADYVLSYRGRKLAIVEAKSDEHDVSEGVAQAKLYAQMMQIRFTYATNGDEIYQIDMGVQDADGRYLVPSTEGPVAKFPSPQELWAWTYPDEHYWRDKFLLEPFNTDGGRQPRYYQENAVNNVLTAIANQQRRILLTMATGTGKTYTAFQICWKLMRTKWNKDLADNRSPRILFVTDRNTLADQAKNDFSNFAEDAMVRITPKELHGSWDNRVPTARSIYFGIFQTFMTRDTTGKAFYMQYPPNFFDFIIIDECHRGGANDESEWRELMDYFTDAYQLGMTATPRKVENANTYKYFGRPVYTYSLKQGIADGFLAPFRVKISTSNIDTYRYRDGDTVTGDIDPNKEYTEKDFYCGNIQIKERDEHRVKEFLGQIDPNEKTIVFCATQQHAAIIRDMINQHKRSPHPDYCKRVTADDSSEGEAQLRLFQNNDKQIPTILTTSQKLSTGVDARNVRNIVLMRPINSIVEFKQIIGRGTRIFDEKYYFTIYDFVGANARFEDAEWDGDPICPTCGNWPCTCHKPVPYPPHDPPMPYVLDACPVCGNIPCTCPAPPTRRKVVVKLSKDRLVHLHTDWDEKIEFDNRLLTVDEFIQEVFGRMPRLFSGPDDLRKRWANPLSRQELLELLGNEGFKPEMLDMVSRLLQMEKADLLDVLEYIAYNTPAIQRAERAQQVRDNWLKTLPQRQQEFIEFILQYYVTNGHTELGNDRLSHFVNIKFNNSPQDAMRHMGVTPQELRNIYLTMQVNLYDSLHVHGSGHFSSGGTMSIGNVITSK